MTPTDGPKKLEANPSPTTGVRLWPLVVIFSLILLALLWIWFVADLTRSWAVVYSGQTLLLGLLCSLLWLAFFSRLAWRTRWAWLAFTLTPLALVAFLFRIDTVSGDLIPSLAWRFAPKPHEKLSAEIVRGSSAQVETRGIDLTSTTPRDYPQFLGPRRDAMIPGVQITRDWDAHPPRLLWRQPIGAGWSSFVVVGRHALTQEQRGPQEMVTCYELESGRLVWSYAEDVYYESKIAGDGPRATPTVDRGRVYTLGSMGSLNCLEGATGKRLWQRDTFADTSRTNTDWGKACSPLVVDDLVLVTGGAARGAMLVAYHCDTGELAWKANDAPTGTKSYASPMLASLADVRQILMINDNTVCGYEPATGKQLWEHPWPGDEPKATQPLIVGEHRLVVASGYGVGTALLELTREGDGQITPREIWANRNLKPKFTNLVVHDGFLYGLDEGILVCLELESGKRRWKSGRYNHGQIMLIGDVILVLAENGEAVLVEATPEKHRELSRIPMLDGKSWSHPVFAPPLLLVRNDHECACYELTLETP